MIITIDYNIHIYLFQYPTIDIYLDKMGAKRNIYKARLQTIVKQN